MTELKKALTTSSDGQYLLPYDLDAVLHEELLRLQPLAQVLSILPAGGKTHEYRKRDGHPFAWFEGETTPANAKIGSYTRETVQTKIQRIWGSVTGFAQAADAGFIDALATELEGSLQGMADLIEYGALFGVADDVDFTGDAYQYTGILPYVFSEATSNVIDGGSAKVTLDMLDQVLAAAAGKRQTRSDPAMWMMSVRMKQVVDGLQTKVQLPLSSVMLADGKVEMAAYGGRAIFESDDMAPASSSSSPSDMSGSAASGGSLTNGTGYKYKIASVTAYGEQVASAATGSITAATPNLKINLSWTADDDALSYMIFRQDAGAGDYQLLDIIPALTYDSAGTVNGSVSTYSDTGAKTRKAVEPLATGEQQIAYVNYNPQRGAAFVGLVDDMGRPIDNLMRFVELARTKDAYDYFIKGYMALRLIYPETCGVIRHVKLS